MDSVNGVHLVLVHHAEKQMQILACQKVKMYLFFQQDAIKASVMTICFRDYDHVLPSRLLCCHFTVPSIILSPTLGLCLQLLLGVFHQQAQFHADLQANTLSESSRVRFVSYSTPFFYRRAPHPPSLSRCAFSPSFLLSSWLIKDNWRFSMAAITASQPSSFNGRSFQLEHGHSDNCKQICKSWIMDDRKVGDTQGKTRWSASGCGEMDASLRPH